MGIVDLPGAIARSDSIGRGFNSRAICHVKIRRHGRLVSWEASAEASYHPQPSDLVYQRDAA